jgi:threonine aldolase
LSDGITELGVSLASPTEANEVFVNLTPEAYTQISAHYAVHKPDPLEPAVRFVCSWATTPEDVDDALGVLGRP